MGKNRLVGIDLLKIITTLMIVALHYIGYSDNLMAASAGTKSLFLTANLLESFFICGVNVFVIISCYLSIKRCDKAALSGVKRAISVWSQTILITVPMAIILLLGRITPFQMKDALNSILPFSTRAYWFISAFIGFSLLLPFLNRSVEKLSARSLLYLAAALTFFYSFVPTFFEIFGWADVQHGYSLVWFITLYYDTAFLTKCTFRKTFSAAGSFIIYVASSFVIFASVVIIEKVGGPLAGRENYIIRNYSSLPILIQAFALFFSFKDLDWNKKEPIKKAISVLAPASLVCYVLHMHPLLKTVYTSFQISRLYPKSVLLFILLCFVVSVCVFLCSVGVYYVLKAPTKKLSKAIGKVAETIAQKLK